MRHRYVLAMNAQLTDTLGGKVVEQAVLETLHGVACISDSCVDYLDEFEEIKFEGGYVRLEYDSRFLRMVVDIDSNKKLNRSQLKVLRESLEGQLTDGIGSACFRELEDETGLVVTLKQPLKFSFTAEEGKAWKPAASAAKSNQTRYKKLRNRTTAIRSKNEQTGKRDFRSLFRLLAKPERDQLFDQIASELDRLDNDLSSIRQKQLPKGNLHGVKLLRQLLQAKLSVGLLDEEGFSLIYKAAGEPKCIQLLLDHGADPNLKCEHVLKYTPLMRAAQLGAVKSVKLLLSHGAKPGDKDLSGRTAIEHMNAHTPHRAEIQSLLKGR